MVGQTAGRRAIIPQRNQAELAVAGAADAALDATGDGYTNLKRYLSGLDPRRRIDWQKLSNNFDPHMTKR